MPILIDSNVLVYLFDGGDEPRRQRALQVVLELGDNGQGCLSAQCLSEFFSVTTSEKRGNPPLLATDLAAQRAGEFSRSFETFPVTPQVVLEAIRGTIQHEFQFWDALIWAAARLNQVQIVFSEDFRDSSVVEGVRFVNPFSSAFQIEDWVNPRDFREV